MNFIVVLHQATHEQEFLQTLSFFCLQGAFSLVEGEEIWMLQGEQLVGKLNGTDLNSM